MAIVFLGVYLWKRNHKSKKQNTSKETAKTVKSKTDILAELENGGELITVPENQPEVPLPIVTPLMMQALRESHNDQFPAIPGVEFVKKESTGISEFIITQGFDDIKKTLEALKSEIFGLKSEIKNQVSSPAKPKRTMSDEQKKINAERMVAGRTAKKAQQNKAEVND
jgi:uncharacterized protein YoxC